MDEKVFYKKLVKLLKEQRLEFLHLTNSKKQGSAAYKLTAYDEGMTCIENFPDWMIPFGGKTHMIEMGIKIGNNIRHKKRKENQLMRMNYWAKHGGIIKHVVTSFEELDNVLKEIGLIK